MINRQSDIIIIGAGAAGIAAAVELGVTGLAVNIIEARDRIGGRIYTLSEAKAFPLELGAEYIHGKEKYLWSLMEHYQFRLGETDGSHWTKKDNGLHYDADFYTIMDAPMQHLLRAAEANVDQSLAQFAVDLKMRLPDLTAAVDHLVAFVEDLTAAPPEQTSLQFIARGELAANTIGQIPYRPLDGYIEILNKLAAYYVKPNQLHLNTQVQKIEWARGAVFVTVIADGQTSVFEAAQALITLPVGVLKLQANEPGAVEFAPPLVQKEEVLTGLAMGQASRIIAVFKRRFWSDLPLVEEPAANSRQFGFLHCATAPISHWWSQYPLYTHQLIGWRVGPTLPALSGNDKDALRLNVVASLSQIFDMTPSAIDNYLDDVYTHDWGGDQLSRGIYSYCLPGSANANRQLAEPVENTLFFAGEATEKTGFSGTVHGALRSGFRAAQEILTVRAVK